MTETAPNPIRDALEPIFTFTSFPGFTSLPDSFVVTKGSSLAGPQLTVGNLRRARAAFDALSSGESVTVPIRVGDLVKVVAHNASCSPHEFTIGTVLPVLEVYEDGSGVDLGDWACRLDEIERVPAEAGEAVAGPVGEAPGVAMKGARSVSDARMTSVPDVRIDSESSTRIYARPVEEPGEVERLTRERDEARGKLREANAERSQLLADLQLLRTEMATAVTHMQDRAEASEARVYFVEAEARRYASNYPEGSDGRNTFVIFADMIADSAALSPAQEGAALSTDAQESGR